MTKKILAIEAPKAPRGWVCGGGVPSPLGRGLERGQCPSPEKKIDFVSQNGDF